jgi:antitoxin VapB
MALNIKDPAVHEAVKQLAALTGESQVQAVANAVNERLVRLQKDDVAARLLAIGHKSARRISPATKQLDHAEMLYDDQGLPA